MIPLNECKNGFLYFISARNSRLGIFDEKQKGFIIRREKFKFIFLDMEFHWDTGYPHGTAMPFKEIEEALINEEEQLAYLTEKREELKDQIEQWDKDYLKEAQRIVRADLETRQKLRNKSKKVESIEANEDGTVNITDEDGTTYKQCYPTNINQDTSEDGRISIPCTMEIIKPK